MASAPKEMRDLYGRLRKLGFPMPFVRECLLPRWWDDKMAKDPALRQRMELRLAKILDIPYTVVADSAAQLPSAAGVVRFKKHRGTSATKLMPSVELAQRVASRVLRATSRLPDLIVPGLDAAVVRDQLTGMSQDGVVRLPMLLRFVWDAGIPVVPLCKAPTGALKFSGMSVTSGGRPVIVVSGRRPEPAWFLFWLAHELGHVARGDLEDGVRVDVDDVGDSDDTERAADRFATTVTTGRARPLFTEEQLAKRLSPQQLKRLVSHHAAEHQVEPGAAALQYASAAQRRTGRNAWPMAMWVLDQVSLGSGPRLLIQEVWERLDRDLLVGSDIEFLETIVGRA